MKEKESKYKIWFKKKETTNAGVLLCMFFYFVSGMIIGGFLYADVCDDKLMQVSDIYWEIVANVADIDFDKVMESREYCEWVLNDEGLNNNIQRIKEARADTGIHIVEKVVE